METETIAMSNKEIERLHILQRLSEGILKQKQAALMLGVSTRQTRNLHRAYQRDGAVAIASKRRGKRSNRAYNDDLKNQAVSIIRDNYADFGPKLASEYLLERHQLKFCPETIRRWMIKDNLWKAKSEKIRYVHPPRLRRGHYGELIQIDGSPHDWFEGRSERCCLIIFIDDATSKIQFARFYKAETTFAYFEIMQLYIEKYGKPCELYSDKHSIFRVNIVEPKEGTGFTQFGRGMKELDITLHHAHSAQAKGRVERTNRTQQDRLVKWLRIEGISDMETANRNLDRYIEYHNNKFAVPPREKENSHMDINLEDFKYVFTLQEERSVSKNLTIQYHNKIYAIKVPGKGYRLRQARVTVCEAQSGEITLLHKNKSLTYEVYDKNQYYSEPVTAKELPTKLKQPPNDYKPPKTHPWKEKTFKRRVIKLQDRHPHNPPTI